jgi:hypothetical protein
MVFMKRSVLQLFLILGLFSPLCSFASPFGEERTERLRNFFDFAGEDICANASIGKLVINRTLWFAFAKGFMNTGGLDYETSKRYSTIIMKYAYRKCPARFPAGFFESL